MEDEAYQLSLIGVPSHEDPACDPNLIHPKLKDPKLIQANPFEESVSPSVPANAK